MAIRVCQLITELAPAGAEQCVYDLATRLGEAFAPHVIALRGGAVADRLRSAGVAVDVLGLCHKADVASLAKLPGLLRRACPDVLHTHLFHADLAGRVAMCAAGVGCATVHTLHVAELRALPWRRAWLRASLGGLDRVVAVSEAVAAFYHRRAGVGRAKLAVIHNGVDARRFRWSSDACRHWRDRLGLTPADRVCLFVGRLDCQKGVDVLLDAFAAVVKRFDQALLLLAGDGPERPAYERQIERLGLAGRVRLLGHVDDVAGLLSAGEMLVMPSRWEGFGLAAAEAAGCELPVIASNVPGLAEVVRHGQTGLLVPPGDADALAGAMERLLGDATSAAIMGALGRKRVLANFRIDRFVAAHANLYRCLARGA